MFPNQAHSRASLIPLAVALSVGWRVVAGFILIAREMVEGEVPTVAAHWMLLWFAAQGVVLGVVVGVTLDRILRFLAAPLSSPHAADGEPCGRGPTVNQGHHGD